MMCSTYLISLASWSHTVRQSVQVVKVLMEKLEAVVHSVACLGLSDRESVLGSKSIAVLIF